MDRVHYFSLNDYAYKMNLDLAIDKIINDKFDFEALSVFDLIELHNICLYFKDKDQLPIDYKNKLESLKKDYSCIHKTLNEYFSKIQENDLISDLKQISADKNEDYNSTDYFKLFLLYVDFSKLSDEFFNSMIDYIPLNALLSSEKFFNRYTKELKDKMLNSDNSIRFLVEKYDESGQSCSYHLPKFEEDEIDKMIKSYVNSPECNYNILKHLSLHSDSNNYKIKRANRIIIRDKMAEFEQKYITFVNSTLFSFIVDPNQTELWNINIADNAFKFIFSPEFFKKTYSKEEIFSIFLNYSNMLNQSGIFASPYFDYDDSPILSDILNLNHVNYYGSPTYEMLEHFKIHFFQFLYFNFLNQNVYLEDAILYFITKINQQTDNLNLNYTFIKDDNYQVRCEHLFNQLEFLLKQYRVYVEEGHVNNDLLLYTKGQMRFCNLPTLVKKKYLVLNDKSDTMKRIMFLLFNKRSTIGYISKETKSQNFLQLIIKHNITLDMFKYESQTMDIDFLLKKSIIVCENGIIKPKNNQISLLFESLNKEKALVYYKLTEKVRNVADIFVGDDYLRVYSRLFTEEEADYLDCMLNNSKYDNALALRNLYEHGDASCLSQDAHKTNYMIGLRLLCMILTKIYDDIIMFKKELS